MELRPGIGHEPHVAFRPLIVVDADLLAAERLSSALEKAGFQVRVAGRIAEMRAALRAELPAYVVLENRLPDGSGLGLIGELRAMRPDIRIVILTAEGSIANAVAAMKLGADDYLTKPVQPGELAAALLGTRVSDISGASAPLSADRVRWEHIQRIYEASGQNVSETARQLGMHRRTLQRILAKRPPR